MATAWKIGEQYFTGTGPTWDSMSTDETHDYDALASHKWSWTFDWEIFAKGTGEIGVQWNAMGNTWGTEAFTYIVNPWTIIRNTKIQIATET